MILDPEGVAMSDPPQADPRAVPVVEDFGARMRRSRQEGPSPPAMLWAMSFSRSISTAPSKLELRISPARCRSFKALSCASTLVTCCRTRSPSATDFAMNLQPHVTDRAKQHALLVVHPPDVYHTVNSQKFYLFMKRGGVSPRCAYRPTGRAARPGARRRFFRPARGFHPAALPVVAALVGRGWRLDPGPPDFVALLELALFCGGLVRHYAGVASFPMAALGRYVPLNAGPGSRSRSPLSWPRSSRRFAGSLACDRRPVVPFRVTL